MVSNVGDGGGLSSSDKKLYKSEYKHAADLFERALNEDEKSDYMFQKDEFRKVMEKSVQALKDAANALNQDSYLEQAKKIEDDLATYQQDGGSKSSIFQLHQDLERAKKLR
jgi:hypothetical protein